MSEELWPCGCPNRYNSQATSPGYLGSPPDLAPVGKKERQRKLKQKFILAITSDRNNQSWNKKVTGSFG